MMREDDDINSGARGSATKEAYKLSRGASIMLERTVAWLENYVEKQQNPTRETKI